MIRVGCGYRDGLGVGRDARNAEHWFDTAFNLGSDYGLIWSAKLAVIRGDLAKAKTILTIGAERDLPPAILALADLELKAAKNSAERERARALYDAAVDEGFPAAEMSLARAMMRGKFGWRNIPEGFRRYKAFLTEAIVVVGERERELLAVSKVKTE